MSSPAPTGTPFCKWLDTVVPALYPNWSSLAKACGVSRANVTYWRKGVTPTVPMLLKLSKATGTSIETLIKYAGYDPEGDPQ